MTISYVAYDLQDGFIMNWLAAGPQVIPVKNISTCDDASSKLQIAQQFYESKSGISALPVERGPLNEGIFTIGEYEGKWDYYRCHEDHFVDLSAACSTGSFLRAWAYTQMVSPAEQEADFTLTAFGPVDVWVNKKKVCHNEQFSDQPHQVSFKAVLDSGKNQVLVRFAGVAAPAATLAIALRVGAAGASVQIPGISVQIPSLIPSISRRNELEAVNETVYLDRDVYAVLDNITITWPEGPEKPSFQDVRLQTASGRIYGLAEDIGEPGSQRILGNAASLPAGPFRAYLIPRAWELYESNIRVTKELDCWVMGRSAFSDTPYGTIEERRLEALTSAARVENDLFAEIAKAALSTSPELAVLEQAVEKINQRQPGSERLLLGLLGGLERFGSQPEFPAQLKDMIQMSALNFRYWKDEPGCDLLEFENESSQILFHACEILAGQRYPELTFPASGLTGSQHQEKAEALALDWMQVRGSRGFAGWYSKAGYADILTALSHMVDLAKSEAVFELASVLMDKVFFTIALNAYKGVLGSVQRRASAATIKSGLLEETSGATRLMWGLGVFNHHTAAPVSLACMQNYELPPLIADIAAGLPQEMWDREQQAGDEKPANKVTYRTPDYMLSSVQDERPGQYGNREHIWQATMGPQSIVFVTHPGCTGEKDAHSPSFWVGNSVLPRVAQWKDTLIAIYNLPEDSVLGFTHAYFPTRDFDEYILRGNIAFARKGSAYLALTASQGLEMQTNGRTAYRELRSYGRHNIWLCQMGRETLDGDFASFQEKVLASAPALNDLKVECQTLRGESLSFGWEGPLLLNGAVQPLHEDGSHYENPFTTAGFPCQEMEIKNDDYLLHLNFSDL